MDAGAFLKGESMTKTMIGLGFFAMGAVSAAILMCCIKVGANADKRMSELEDSWETDMQEAALDEFDFDFFNFELDEEEESL